MPFELHHVKASRIILVVDHEILEILDYILLVQIRPKLPVCPQKGYSGENLLTLLLCTYCAL